MRREIFRKLGVMYRTAIIVLFKLLALLMIAAGVLIALLILADKMLNLGWGYPWWALLFCVLYIGVSILIYRGTPSAMRYLDERKNRTPSDHVEPPLR
jgi:membrane protein implicated in regulation of membrane protease activity